MSVDPADPAPSPSLWRRLVAPPRFGAALGAFVFWVLSLWPTLLPRSWTVQAGVSAACAAIGWLIGTTVQWAVEKVLTRTDRMPSARTRAMAWVGLGIADTVVGVPALLLWVASQNEQRRTIGLDEISTVQVVPLVLLTAVLGAVFVIVGRLVFEAVRGIDRQVAKKLIRPGWARALSAAIVVVLVVVLVNVGQRRFVDWADEQFGALNETTEEGVTRPTLPTVSGSPESLVPWETLGFQGRSFTAGATPAADLAAFAGPDETVLDPIRVYVGLDSAETPSDGVLLALDELERTGAFEREVLVVATATGTGWINPVAARTLEYLHGGDTAIVSQQYSFLPSWIAFLVDPGNASDIGEALFSAVHARWSELPEGERPQLVVFGESLGSFGTEAGFVGPDIDASLASLADRTQGALFIGPTADNPVWGQLIDDRDPGSPTWQPGLDRNPNLRVENTAADIDGADPTWETPRILYVYHPTDAVGTWAADHIWSPPGWTERPTGFGVPDRVRWFPIVTWVQETADLMAGFSAEPGFGHDYTDGFVAGWSAVAPPNGWTADDTERLETHLGSIDDG